MTPDKGYPKQPIPDEDLNVNNNKSSQQDPFHNYAHFYLQRLRIFMASLSKEGKYIAVAWEGALINKSIADKKKKGSNFLKIILSY